MNLFICTISFRHQLISIEELATWANRNHFQGIELWGIHAKNLIEQPQYGREWLQQQGLRTTMISDYLPLSADANTLFDATQQLVRLCKHWGSKKIRTFAGETASANTSASQRNLLIERLQKVCDWLKDEELNLVIEAHPNTYADNIQGICCLIEQVNRDNFKLNFDVLHIWESGAEVEQALQRLAPHVQHFHLKNISAFDNLDIFAPPNVYAPSGKRDAMVPLFEGALDCRAFFEALYLQPHLQLNTVDASLEWFGPQSKATLARDRYLIRQIQQQFINTATGQAAH
ncbi:MAG: sugar phosphate isomerase/epimerase [Cellvibrionaceae bacterium]|nr:sugar phosphate isomerase/epimerase [Cellvibrionaceae bacterium]